MPDYKKLFEVMQSRRIIDANIPDADTWGSSLINDETRLKATHKALVFDMKMSGAKTPPPSYEEFVGMLSPLKKKADTPVSGGGVQPVSPVSTGGSEVDPLFPPPTEKPKPLTKEQKALAAKGLSGGIPVEEAEQMAKDVKLRELDTKTPDWTRNIADEIGEVPDAPDPRNYQPFDAFGTPIGKAKELTDQEVVDFYNTNRNNPQMGGDPMNFPLLGVQGARKAREFYNAQFKPENNPKYKADLAAYNLKMDKLKAENPVMAMPVEIVREGKALRQKADKLGITPKELFESKRGQLAETYLTDEFKQENEVLGRLEYAQEQYKKFLRNSLTTKLGSDTYKGELERLGTEVKRAQEDYVKYQLQMTDSIDGQIKALKTQLGALEDEGDIRDVQRQIKQLEQRKELFINPQAGIGVAEEVLKVGRITSHDQIQEAYLALSNHRDKLKAKFEAETGTIAPVGGAVQQGMQRYLSGNFGFMTGGDTLKELAKVEEQLTALAPIALVNRSPIGDDMGSMERFGKSALKVISPGANRAGQKLTSQDLSKNTFEFLDVMQAEGLVPQKQTEALGEAGEQPRFNTPDWWADTMGVTAGILPSFAIGGGVLTGAKGAFALTRGGAAMLETLAAIKQGVKTQPLARAIYSGIESGIDYKAVGTLFSANPTVSEEGTFAAGFLGGVLSSPIEALDLDVIGAKVLGVFGKKADDFTVATQRVGRVIKAAGILNQRGIAETLEEYGNEIGNMYMESDTWADMKGQLEERFGTLDQNVEFIVATYVMGMGMGLPSVAGKLAMERSSRAYNEVSPETRAKVDEILPAVNEAVGVENVPPVEQPPVGGSAPSDVDLEAEEIARRQREEAGLEVPAEETAVEEVPAPPVAEQTTADVGGVKSPDVSPPETADALVASPENVALKDVESLTSKAKGLSLLNEKEQKRILDLAANEATLSKQESQELSILRGKRDKGMQNLEREFQNISERNGGKTDPKSFNRQDRQQWRLLQRELQMVNEAGADVQQTKYGKITLQEWDNYISTDAGKNWLKNTNFKEKSLSGDVSRRIDETRIGEEKKSMGVGIQGGDIGNKRNSEKGRDDSFNIEEEVNKGDAINAGDYNTIEEQEKIIESTAKALEGNSKAIEDIQVKSGLLLPTAQVISEAYHKAKQDGSNPELVKAVEDLLGAPKETLATTKAKVEQVVETPTEEVAETEADEVEVETPSVEIEKTETAQVETPTESKPDVKAEAPKADVVAEEVMSSQNVDVDGNPISPKPAPRKSTEPSISEDKSEESKTTASEAKASKLSGLKKKKKPDEFKDEATPLEAVASERGNVGEVSASYGSKNAFQEAISSAVSTAMVLGGKVFNRLSGRAKDGKTPRKRKYYSGSTVAKGMAANGRVDVSSVDANNPVALAELFGFIRNPFVENTVVAFTKGGRVVSYSVLSSGLFNTTPSGISELGKGVGADGFYLIHNHPSGNPTPSSSDVRITREASEQGKAKGLEMKGSLVLNGGKFANVKADGTHEMLSYGEKSFFEAGSDARNLAGQAAFILNDTGSQYALVFSDAQEKIIDWHPIPSNLEGQALTSYVSSLYKARGGANVRIIGDVSGVGALFKDAKTPSNTLEVIDPYSGDVYKVDGDLLDMTLMDGMMDETSSEIPSNLDPEGVETLTEVVIDTIRAGQSPTLEFLIKNLIAEEMEEWIPELVFAYQRVRSMPNVTIEIRNEMSSSARIGELSSPDGIKKLKEEYAKEQEQKQREREASERRKALIGDLDIAERPVYDRGTGGYDGANAGRPVLRYALPVGADVSASDVVVEVIKEGQYKSIDEHQRYGVNAILTNYKKGLDAFMLADGPGVGKSLQLIVAAIEGYKMTGKKSLIVTENRAIVAKNFVADGTKLLDRLYFPEIEFATYSSLDKVKGDYGFVLLDEAHNMKNATSQKSQTAMTLSRKADFTVYSTATPADKATHLHYWMPQMLGVSQLDVEEMLGFETISVHLKGEKTPRLEAKFNIPFAEYLQRLVGLRNKLIAEGKMLRRNYPFYGSVGEALMGVPQEVVDIENKIEEYFNRKGKAIRSMMAKRNASPIEIEGALRRNNETKVGYQERALEPYKLPYVNSVVQTELDAGRKVVIMFAAAADEVSIELSKTDKVTIPNAIKQMQDRLKQQGVVYGLMTGKTREDNTQTAENFRKGKIKVVMGTFQSMSTGIDLDDQIGDQPVTLVMASFPKSAQIFEQALFRVSRRNTKSPAKVITVFAKTPSDNRARKRFESKAQVMNSINEGTAQTDNITDSSFDPSFVAETQTAGVLVPRMVYNEDNNTFSVVNLNGVYERLIAVGGGQYRKGGDLGNRVVFPITAIADVERVIEDYVSTSDTRETLEQIHAKNVEEFWRAVRASRGTTNMNLPNMWPVMVNLGKMASSYIAVNGAKLQGFLNLVKKFGRGFLPVARSIFTDMVNMVRKPMRKTPRGVAAKAYNDLTEIEKKIFDNHLKWAEGTSQNYAQYMSKLNALIVGLGQQQNPSSKAVSKALETFRAYAMTMQANSVTDMEVYKKSIALDTEARIGGEAVKGALSSPTFSFSEMIAKVRRNLRLATSKIDRPFKAITTEFENPIRNRYAKPLSRDRHEMLLEHQAEALKGVVGRAILNRDRIWKEVTGGTTINGEFSPRLSKAERVLFEYYLFARRAKDRVSVKIDKDGNEIKTSTGNVSAAMADAMIAYVINALPDSRSIQDFEARADAFQTVMDDNLQMLLKAGKISQASYDAIKERNDFYATFKVVQEGVRADDATKYDNSTRADASIVKKMRGIAERVAKTYGLKAINDLAIQLDAGTITLDEFFNNSAEELDLALTSGAINEAQYLELVSTLGSAGFQVTSILEAAESILYRSVISSERNMFVNKMAEMAEMDVDKETAYVAPLQIGQKYEEFDTPTMQAIPFSKDGIRMVLVVDRAIATAMQGLTYKQLSWAQKAFAVSNKMLRAAVITSSTAFFITNSILDAISLTFQSKLGLLMGAQMDRPILNVPMQALRLPFDLTYSFALSLTYRLANFKSWKKSSQNRLKQMGIDPDKDMFSNYIEYLSDQAFVSPWQTANTYTFSNEGQKAWGSATKFGQLVSKIPNTFYSLLELVSGVSDETIKITAFNRKKRLEAAAKRMAQNDVDNMYNDAQVLMDYANQLSREVRNTGSPDFANIPVSLQALALVFPMIGARVKGILWDLRRTSLGISNIGYTMAKLLPKDNPIRMYYEKANQRYGADTTEAERNQIMFQQIALMATLSTMAASLFFKFDDDDEDKPKGLSYNSFAEALEMFYPNLSKDYINVPTGHFYETEVSYIDPSGNIITAVEIVPEFFQIRVRGTLKAAWNGVYEGTRSGGNFTTKNINDIIKTLFEEVSPINIRGNTARDKVESVVSALTPAIKTPYEVMANRNTYTNRYSVSMFKMLRYEQYQRDLMEGKVDIETMEQKGYAPWQIYNPYNSDESDDAISKFLYNNFDIMITSQAVNTIRRGFGMDEYGRGRRMVLPSTAIENMKTSSRRSVIDPKIYFNYED